MHLQIYLAWILTIPSYVSAQERRAPARIAVTNHVLPLVAAPYSPSRPMPPSSQHLHRRRNIARRQSPDIYPPTDASPLANTTTAPVQQSLDTIGGRIYMTNITLAGEPYTVVIDTGSSDTWVASSTFVCTSRFTRKRLPQRACGFGQLYDVENNANFTEIEDRKFSVRYSDGEYLNGDLGEEDLGIVGEDGQGLTVRQTIGVVKRGWWMGDSFSSGLMGLAYATLASNYKSLNYTTVPFSIFATHSLPPLFSLALSRPAPPTPHGGGLLAIGGIPSIAYTAPFTTVPINPIVSSTYAFYSIPVDGFDITPPPSAPVHNRTLALPSKQGRTIPMVLDSGSTLLYLPDKAADYLASQFVPPARFNRASGTYTTACASDAPRFGVIVKGRTFWVNPVDMVNFDGVDERGARSCTVAVQRMGDGDAVLGDTFMKNVVVVFDLGANEVRIAGREVY